MKDYKRAFSGLFILVALSVVFAGCSNGSGSSDTHQHTFATEWSTSEDFHWHAATCEHKDLKKDLGSHVSSGPATAIKAETCTVCGYVITPKLSYIGPKAPSEAKEVGDVVFTDGSAKHYEQFFELSEKQKNAAVAFIFYVGDGLNDEGDTSVRTLGVGFKHDANKLPWCVREAKAWDKDITTIHENDKNGKDNLEQIAAILGAEDDTKGEGAETRYPAFYFAKNYKNAAANLAGTAYEDGWYLPTIAEIQAIKDHKNDIDDASELCGGSKFEREYYWSANQYPGNLDNCQAYYYSFMGATDFWTSKDTISDFYNLHICAIREF